MTPLMPCPFCGSEFIVMHVDRMRISSLKCDGCGAMMESDSTHCNDSGVDQLAESLAGRWNRRDGE